VTAEDLCAAGEIEFDLVRFDLEGGCALLCFQAGEVFSGHNFSVSVAMALAYPP
jgi:hypothetical protein